MKRASKRQKHLRRIDRLRYVDTEKGEKKTITLQTKRH